MKNIIKRISWLQKRPNGVIVEAEEETFKKSANKTSKPRGKKGGIGCPDCPK